MLQQLLCLFLHLFCSLGTHCEQALSGDKSSTIGSGGLINDSVPPKDPEEGGLLLPEPSYTAVVSFFFVLNPCLKAECYLTSLGENCEGNADPESLSDIDDVEVLSQ
jgi:transcription factor IIIB 90 kDa subunit